MHENVQRSPTLDNSIVFRNGDGSYSNFVVPKTRAELKFFFEFFFGLILAEKAVCGEHISPLDAVCAYYLDKEPVVLIKGSRGLSGKSRTLAGLAVLELLSGSNLVVLGGSAQQSRTVHEAEIEIWNHDLILPDGTVLDAPLKSFLAEEPTQYITKMKAGNKLQALTASQTSVRGKHPEKLFLDEADEMSLAILESSFGMPMQRGDIVPQILITSTHQYPDGTMSELIRRAHNRNWYFGSWCFKETHQANGGWLSQDLIDFKKGSMPQRMWEIEFELQEPSIEGRLFETAHIQNMFTKKVIPDKVGEVYEFETPIPQGRYITGADWGKQQDYTVIITLRIDCDPVKIVAFERRNKEDWNLMFERFNARVRRYPGKCAHDGLGIGSVISDMLDHRAIPFMAVGKKHHESYRSLQVAIENGRIRSPAIQSLKHELTFVTYEDIFVPNAGKHIGDTIAALNIAWTLYTGYAESSNTGFHRKGHIMKPRRW